MKQSNCKYCPYKHYCPTSYSTQYNCEIYQELSKSTVPTIK